MNDRPPSIVDAAAEGDVNLSPLRREFEAAHVHAKTRALLDADADVFLHQSLSTPCFNALAACEGIWLTDVEGRRIMDFHGNSVHQVGYRHPHVMAAVREQLDTLPFSPRRFTNEPAIALATQARDARAGSARQGPVRARRDAWRSGWRSSSRAWPPAATRRCRCGTASMARRSTRSRSAARRCSARGSAPSSRAPSTRRPAIRAPAASAAEARCNLRCADYLDYVLGKEEDIGAVVIETVRSTDVQVPPPEYYRKVRAACDRHGALLILDEIPICLGRTGRMFAFEHYDVVPDMVVLGKGLGGAVFPLAALIARRDLDIAADRALGHYTHEKSSVGCAAALATLDVIESEALCERARTLGASALARLREMQARHPLVAEVRGIGLLLAVELARDGAPARREAEQVMYECLARGLSFKVGQGNVLTLSPPLVIAEAELDAALDILDAALTAVEARAA